MGNQSDSRHRAIKRFHSVENVAIVTEHYRVFKQKRPISTKRSYRLLLSLSNLSLTTQSHPIWGIYHDFVKINGAVSAFKIFTFPHLGCGSDDQSRKGLRSAQLRVSANSIHASVWHADGTDIKAHATPSDWMSQLSFFDWIA